MSTAHSIYDIRHLSPPSASLLSQLRAGLSGHKWIGDEAATSSWRYKKSLPTMLLYDEEGLKLYEKITTDCTEYYLYPLELALLEEHASSIVDHLFPSKDEREGEQARHHHLRRPPVSHWRIGEWGDSSVGKYNGGVNSEEGLDGSSVGRSHDASSPSKQQQQLEGIVLELGAGSLGKTSHLLRALADRKKDDASSYIQYLALDLDKNELDRTLNDVKVSLGPQLDAGNVKTGGVWGTFDAGLEWVQDGDYLDAISRAQGGDDTVALGRLESRSESCSISKSYDETESTPSSSPPTALPSSFPPSPPHSECSLLLDNHSAARNDGPVNSIDGPIPPKHFLFLGSSLGNFSRDSAPAFLRSIPLRPGSGDSLVLGLDHRNEEALVQKAYNDPSGCTRRWAENMWNGVSRLVGKDGLGEGWEYTGRYNVKEGRHEAYFRSLKAQTLSIPASSEGAAMEAHFDVDELINIEWSYKYSDHEAQTLFEAANLRPTARYTDANDMYSIWILERPPFKFTSIMPSLADPTMAVMTATKSSPVPTTSDWEELWRFWDTIILGMIPEKSLHQKPIDLRHKNLFYLGHIPAFLDIFLSRHLEEPHTEPEHFKDIFERGIDPNVDDPSQIHDHSIVPEKDEDWPTLEEILSFRDRVRQRLLALYTDVSAGTKEMSRRLGRVLFMVFEHEALHAETLLYMLLQSPDTLPPPGFTPPHFPTLSLIWDAQHARDATLAKTLTLGSATVTLGHHDLESEDAQFPTALSWEMMDHEFGWDNEHGVCEVKVGQIEVERKAVTNGEYRAFLKKEGKSTIPGSWIEIDGEWMVKSLYGPVAFAYAQHWPLMASYCELAAYAAHRGGRLPTEAELRLWLDTSEGDRTERAGTNVGVRNWHPVPGELSYVDPTGRTVPGHNGGVWEWTSTELEGLPAHEGLGEGYVKSTLYPGYSSDFFDGKHMVVLGGSFATIPRISGRRSFRNFYQLNYPFAWIGGRVVYDVKAA